MSRPDREGWATIEAMRHSTELRLPRTLDAGRRARRFTSEVCAKWRVPALAPDAAVIAAELVENTLRHTRAAPRLGLELHRDELTVKVSDDDPHAAVIRESGYPPGLGLPLVARTSWPWGSERAPSGGKTVWATVR